MSHNSGLIEAPVSVDDVADCLGMSRSSTLADLCKSANINMWAKCKPVSYAKAFDITDAEKKTINYGLTVPTTNYTILSGDKIKEVASSNWGYTKPSGGSNSPFRLGDFKNYYHNAGPLIQVNYPLAGYSHSLANSRYFELYFSLDPEDSTYTIQAYDLNQGTINLKEYKFAVAVYSANGSLKGVYLSDPILDSNGNIQGDVITIDVDGWSTSTYSMYACMVKQGSGVTTYIPLPKVGDYNPTKMLLYIDASAGLEVVDNSSNTSFAPQYGSTYYNYNAVMDEGTPQYAMSNYDGTLLVHIKVKNKSASRKTYYRENFVMVLPKNDVPDSMFTSEPNGSGGVKSVTFNGGETKDLWFEYSGFLYNVTSTDKYNTVEIEMQVSGPELFNGSLYYHRGVPGWTKI